MPSPFPVDELIRPACPSDECYYKVCLCFDFGGESCNKGADEYFSHVCVPTVGGDCVLGDACPSIPEVQPGVEWNFKYECPEDCTDEACQEGTCTSTDPTRPLLKDAEVCVYVGAGEDVYFNIKDGNGACGALSNNLNYKDPGSEALGLSAACRNAGTCDDTPIPNVSRSELLRWQNDIQILTSCCFTFCS